MDSAKPSEASPLAGPAAVTVAVASPRGPFARKGASIALPTTQIRVANVGGAAVTIASLTLDPLQRIDSGVAADAQLAANIAQREIQPGESALLTISGHLPAQPATYSSTLRVATQDGARLPVRIEFRVAAAARWGFGCMVLGLLTAGLLSLLDGESGIRGQLRHALSERQSAHESLQRSPPPQSLAGQADSLNREYDTAIEILQRRREISFIDRRGSDAQERLDSAGTMRAALDKAMAAKPRGSIEVDDLGEQWAALRKSFAETGARFLVPAPQGLAFAQRLRAFDAWAAQRLLAVPIRYYTDDFDYRVNQVRLLYAAERAPVAAAQAVNVRRWMQRAADVVSTQAQLASFYAQLTANNVATAERIRRRAEAAGVSPDRRAAVLGLLDEASASLTEPFDWPMRRTVNERILAARTEALRAETEAVLAAALMGRAQEEKDDSLAAVEAVVAEGAKLKRGADGKIDASAKIRWLQRTVAAWRTRLATFFEPAPPAMNAELDALAAAVDAGDLSAVATHSQAMFEQWAAFSGARGQAMVLKTTAPFCVRLRDDTLVDLHASQESMRRLEAHPKLSKWEGQIDQLAMQARASPDVPENMPLDCLTQLVELSGKAFNLSNEIDSALWDAASLPDATRRQLVLDHRANLTPETLRNLLSDLRPLQLEVATPPEERNAGREIEFRVTNLDPIWGPGVTLAMDFNDGQIKTATAEELRKNRQFTHVYSGAKSWKPSVVAAEAFAPGTANAIGKMLGKSEPVTISVSPSPISLAREAADRFVNARFGLALLIAGMLYFWRYQSMKTVFGASLFDYAQAFALGFVVSVAVDQLPQKFAEFIK
ncbi:MAG: hypothetical protein ABI537_04675 [Casimicrobiaceae bacterium]